MDMGFHQAHGKLACNHYWWNTRDAETFYRHVHDGGQGGAGVKSHRRQIGPTEQRSDEGIWLGIAREGNDGVPG